MLITFSILLFLHSFESSAQIYCDDVLVNEGQIKLDNVLFSHIGESLKIYNTVSGSYSSTYSNCDYLIFSSWRFR